MPYESFFQKNTIRDNWDRIRNNENNIKGLEKKVINLRSVNFNKSIITIPVLVDQPVVDAVDLNNDIVFFEIQFEGIPEWVIPMIEIAPIFKSESGVDIDQPSITFTADFNYFWDIRDKENPLLKVHASGEIFQSIQFPMGSTAVILPLFIDLNLKIVNTRIFDLIQHERGQ